jgi:hypothetical protein
MRAMPWLWLVRSPQSFNGISWRRHVSVAVYGARLLTGSGLKKSSDHNTIGPSAPTDPSKNLRYARSLLNRIAQSHELIHSLICLHIVLAFKTIHRRGANRALHCLALIQHRELDDHPIEVVAEYFTSLQRHRKFSNREGLCRVGRSCAGCGTARSESDALEVSDCLDVIWLIQFSRGLFEASVSDANNLRKCSTLRSAIVLSLRHPFSNALPQKRTGSSRRKGIYAFLPPLRPRGPKPKSPVGSFLRRLVAERSSPYMISERASARIWGPKCWPLP